jgi:hypothetical protein
MTTSPSQSTAVAGPSLRAIRMWLGLMLIVLLGLQVGGAIGGWSIARADAYRGGYTPTPYHSMAYWHGFTVAVSCALLAMVTVIGAVGLILDAAWAWRVAIASAALHIAVTVFTQVWEANLDYRQAPGDPLLGAIIGVLVWNVIPIGILVLAVAGQRRAAAAKSQGAQATA